MSVRDLRGSPKVAVNHRARAKARVREYDTSSRRSRGGRMIAKVRKPICRECLAGLGVSVASVAVCIEERVWDREQQSRCEAFKQGWHRHRRRAHASSNATFVAPVMRRQPHPTTRNHSERPCKSLPKPSGNPHSAHARARQRLCRKIRYLHTSSSSALPCATSAAPSPSIALTSLNPRRP